MFFCWVIKQINLLNVILDGMKKTNAILIWMLEQTWSLTKKKSSSKICFFLICYWLVTNSWVDKTSSYEYFCCFYTLDIYIWYLPIKKSHFFWKKHKSAATILFKDTYIYIYNMLLNKFALFVCLWEISALPWTWSTKLTVHHLLDILSIRVQK